MRLQCILLNLRCLLIKDIMSLHSSESPFKAIEQISFALPSEDLLCLRLVCKAFYQGSLGAFHSMCLQTISTDLSLPSLKKLQKLSENPELGPWVQGLVIKSESNRLGKGFRWRRHEDGHLFQPVTDIHVLRDILLNGFTKCRSFHFMSSPADQMDTEDNTDLTPSDSIALILTLIAETALYVQSFRIDLQGQGSEGWDACRFHMPYYQTNEFGYTWPTLQELCLQVAFTSTNFRAARGLICNAKYLRRFSLDVETMDPILFCDLLPVNCCSRLEELRLTSIGVSLDALSEFIFRSAKTLRLLSLDGCSIHGENACATILNLLGTNFALLESITISTLQDVEAQQQHQLILFPGLERSPIPFHWNFQSKGKEKVEKARSCRTTLLGASYQGNEMGQALTALMASLRRASV